MEVNIELYVKQKDRWLIDATFPGFQEDVAVEEAKQMANHKHVQAVKVIKEQHDPSTGTKTEKTVFTTEVEKSAEDYKSETKESDEKNNLVSETLDQGNYEEEEIEEVSRPKKKKLVTKKKKVKNKNPLPNYSVKLIVKLLIIVSLSLCIATIVTLLFERFGLNLYYKFGLG
ncbi:hypothetical protein OAK17_04480 [Alphaproteobacteria bacterium]|nr:hypothetical protein [Alphaproteobacteria bacterium]